MKRNNRELTIEDFAKAIIQDEPDRAKIKWRKRKWTLPRGKTTTRPPTHRPKLEVYYKILEAAGKGVCVCVHCGSEDRITVHHFDGNPYNNNLENLQVLCWNCHSLLHEPSEGDVHHELEGTRKDIE